MGVVPLSFETVSLTRTWGSSSRLGWLASDSKGPFASASPVLGFQVGTAASSFLMGAEDVNSGHHVHLASIFPTIIPALVYT